MNSNISGRRYIYIDWWNRINIFNPASEFSLFLTLPMTLGLPPVGVELAVHRYLQLHIQQAYWQPGITEVEGACHGNQQTSGNKVLCPQSWLQTFRSTPLPKVDFKSSGGFSEESSIVLLLTTAPTFYRMSQTFPPLPETLQLLVTWSKNLTETLRLPVT